MKFNKEYLRSQMKYDVFVMFTFLPPLQNFLYTAL